MLNFRQENIEVQNHPFHVLCTDLNSVGASGHFFTFFIAAAELINHDNPKNLIAGAVARFEIYEDPGQFIRDPASCRIEDASVHVEYDLIANTNKKNLKAALRSDSDTANFANGALTARSSNEQEIAAYKQLYPGHPILEIFTHPMTHEKHDCVRLSVGSFKMQPGVSNGLDKFYKFVDFIAKGSLIEDKGLAEALAAAIKQCIPNKQFRLEGDKAIDTKPEKPKLLPADYRKPGVKTGWIPSH